MARVKADVFGFEELEKAFAKVQKKYPDSADAFLMTAGKAVYKRTRQLTPVKTRMLRNSWRLKKVKLYRNGTVRVVRVQSTAPHAHLVELGHEMIRGGRASRSGKKLNRVQRSVRGITSGGYVEGKYMLETAMTEAKVRFNKDAQGLIDKLTEDLEV